MSKQVIYMDLDDTVKDTERYIRRLMAVNGQKLPKTGTIYAYINTPMDDLILEVFDNYDAIPFRTGAENAIELLSTEFEIIFCSRCTTKKEEEGKIRLADRMKKDIIICKGENRDKSKVDMRGGICVDDRADVLLRCNADRKFEMYSPYQFDLLDERDPKSILVDWFSLVDLLMEAPRDEDIRRSIYSGIQRRSTAFG